MEQPNTIFSLNIDPVTKSHLLETSKWARFLAIAGMVSLVFLVIIGLYMSTVMTTNMNEQFETSPNSSELAKGLQVGIAIVYIIIAIV